jgi:hypothetical protein
MVTSVWWTKYKNGFTGNSYDSYTITANPDDGILDNPKLEYSAQNCKTCKLEIIPLKKVKVSELFLDDNKDVFIKNQEPVKKMSTDRYLFEKSKIYDNSMILDITNLFPSSYQINVNCWGPDQVEPSTDSVKLNLIPYIRWREIIPVIN